jgi:hypothetical protein
MKTSFSLLLALLLVTPAMAELYQWKDENGRVHFSDKKPGTASATTLQVPAAQRPSGHKQHDNARADDAAEPSPQARQQRLLQVMKQEADQRDQAKRLTEKKRQENDEACRQLREHQSGSEGRRLFYTDKKDEKGERIYLDESQRKEYDEQITAIIAEKCTP